MAESTNNEEIPADELICPITLELFRDPVRAKDGHVYERQAITRWILQHGTSPLTREPLQINDLQSDEQLKSLARARRSSTVSYNAHGEQVTLPPLQRLGRYSHRVAPAGISTPRTMTCPFQKNCCRILLLIVLCVAVPVCITIVSIVLSRSLRQARVTSTYSSTLTLNSSTFTRLSSPTNDRYYYNKIGIRVSRSGVYEFSSESGIDMYGYLYINPFNDTNVSLNILTSDDDSGRSTQFYFRYSLQSNWDYILIATTSSANVTGSYTITIRGLSTVTFFF